ncbi:DUF308 domain-containing protein [Candidatus Saccharibacteria bacterium]|nr:DUF308 domain-containing protein [Candidatus Saccharibacteria bacterium]
MAKAEIIKQPVEQVGGEIKKTAWLSIFESLALIIIGLLFIILQQPMVEALSYVVGAFFIVKGGFQIINYFIDNGPKDFFNNNLLSGVVSVLIGVAFLAVGEDITNVFRIIIGIIIIYESLVRINSAIKLANAKIETWKYILILALLMLVMGVFVTFYQGAVITLVGALMIATGVIGVVGDAMFIQHINTIVERLTGASDSAKSTEK